MSSFFASLAGLARTTVERVHGEAVTILPMDRPTGPNGKRQASSVRAAWSVSALFYREAEGVDRDMLSAFPRGGSGNAGGVMRAGRHTASVGKGPEGQLPIEGDILRQDDGSLAHFEITSIDPDGLGHFTLTLATIKAPT
ncbi:hypothetical protein [Mesorhizobium sp. M0522]|uniref:hypothetical protein n=1 Tax=Mesorhizobium sp. M0522 TaxID=2956958 RepID=UPI00333AB338